MTSASNSPPLPCLVEDENLFSAPQMSFSDIARVLSEFFRDLDLVPTDVVVGLVLLRQRQQNIRAHVVKQVSEGSGEAVCPPQGGEMPKYGICQRNGLIRPRGRGQTSRGVRAKQQ